METSIGITPRLRMARHSPTHNKSVHPNSTAATISEAPSRLPEFSQLVNLNLKDMEVSDDNIYASDIASEPTRQQAQTAKKTESPAAVLRALLSRLPNNDEGPIRHPDHDTERQYPSERESDYDVGTASGTPSVAQSKNIFSGALRHPGDTSLKDKSHRRRSSSIAGTDLENTPHILEARNIKGKRRSLSDDEVENANRTPVRPRTRQKTIPQPLTQEFLRERFGKFSVSHQDSPRNGNALDSSQTSPPLATSTPQRSLMSFDRSRFNSNLLDKDSEMQNAIAALDSSMDNLSSRSVSPIPTLQIDSEPVEDETHTRLNGVTDSKIHPRGSSVQKSLQATPQFTNKDRSFAQSTAKASRSKLPVYDKHDTLGEQSMSLSLPVGHINLQPSLDHSRLTNGTNGNLSRQHSVTALRPSSPMPDHQRPHTPVDAVHERERNWNKRHPIQHRDTSPHLSHHSSMSSIRADSPFGAKERENKWDSPTAPSGSSPRSRNHSFSSSRPKSPMHRRDSPIDPIRAKSPMHRRDSPIDPIHDRERNWNSPHPTWHNGSHTSKEGSVAYDQIDDRLRTNSLSRESSHGNGHLHARHSHTPPLTRNPPSRPLSPLPPEKSSPSVTRASSLRADHHSRRPPSMSPSPSIPTGTVAMNGPRHRPGTPARKSPQVSTMELTNESRAPEEKDLTTRGHAVSPYEWPVTRSDRGQLQPTLISNGHTPAHGSDADDVRETDYSSSSSRVIEPPDVSDEEHQGSEFMKAPNGDSTMPPTDAVQADVSASPSTPPRRVARKLVKLEPKTPSPPKTLPDLPTPSSSDESNNTSLRKMPKLGTAHQNRWLQTPKPPGGWLATPQPAKDTFLDEPETPVPGTSDFVPETPVASEASRFVGKTPKPPGSWATPASAPLRSDSPDNNGPRSQLLTPINSLSKSSALSLKTPGVPGSWVNTPAARKTVLKVRFDPQSPEVKEESVQGHEPESKGEESNLSDLDNSSQVGDAQSLPSPRSPRRAKANIRVLDAFGREETPSSSPKKENASSRNGFRMLDAMGRDIKEEQSDGQDTMEESTSPLTRDELLSRLRQGLNELVEDIDVIDKKEDIFASDRDRSRIKELVETSEHARSVRRKLFFESRKLVLPRFVKPPYVSFRWKMWLGLILSYALLLCLTYRICLIQTRNYFLNGYYDPFNPERHLYLDNTIHLPRLDLSLVWPSALLRDGANWSTWFESIDIASYLSSLLSLDVPRAWTPT